MHDGQASRTHNRVPSSQYTFITIMTEYTETGKVGDGTQISTEGNTKVAGERGVNEHVESEVGSEHTVLEPISKEKGGNKGCRRF